MVFSSNDGLLVCFSKMLKLIELHIYEAQKLKTIPHSSDFIICVRVF